MARLPKVKLRAIPVFPSSVVGGTGIEVTKVSGVHTVALNVSDINISSVAEADQDTTYAISWGQVTDDNPDGSFQLVPYTGLQGTTADDITTLADLGTTGVVVRVGDADYVTQSPAALTKTDDTNVTLTLGGTPTTALLQATSITVGWTGSLSAARGGTGKTAYGVGDLLVATGTTTLSQLNAVATGNALISAGVTTAPAWGKIGLTTHVSGTLPVANGGTGITSLGTGVATALGINVGSAGAPVINGGALGSPSSVGTLPAFTLGGTVSGGGNNLNNVVIGAVSPLAGSFSALAVGNGLLATPSVLFASGVGFFSTAATNVTFATGGVSFADFNTTGFNSYRNGAANVSALQRTDTHGSATDIVNLQFTGRNASGSAAAYARIDGHAVSDTAGAHSGRLELNVAIAGTVTEIARVEGPQLRVLPGTAVPAGGTTGSGVALSSTSNLGVFFGSGLPTLSAAQGSLYLRTDGSSTSTRLYVNTNGTTGWTNVTTAT